jgi:hypothetical protein
MDEGRNRRRRNVLLLGLAGAVVFLALSFVALRPVAVLGVDGTVLQKSIDSFSDGRCDRLPGDEWRCVAYDRDSSGDAPFRVNVDGYGCWTAAPEHPGGRLARLGRRSGCITITDFIF